MRFTSKLFLSVCALAACLMLLSTALAANVIVPNVVGMPGLDANKALQKVGLNPQYSMDATPTSDKTKADKIVKQDPPSGRAVSSGSVVTLYVYMYQAPAPPKPQMVTIPYVVGKKNTDAYAVLKSLGLHSTEGIGITSTPDKSKLYTIASQNPAAGQSVAPGSVVTLVVYNVVAAPIATAKIPNMYRMDAAQAKQSLATLGFKNYTVFDVPTKVMGDQGKVLGQQPAAGTSIPITQTVTLQIGSYRR
jgi:serine/threonine-protein kinase